MKQRQFPLSSVLEVRALAKKTAEDNLALALRERSIIEQTLADARATLTGMADALIGNRFTADLQTQGLRALSYQEQCCRQIEEQLKQAILVVNQRRQELVSAHQDHEAILKLQMKWRAELQRVEAKVAEIALDDFVNSRFASRQSL